MPTETQLEQRVAALKSDLNARDQALDDAATENNERELSRRSWLDEAKRLEKENEGLRSEVKRLDLMVSQADHDYEMKRNDLERQLAERDALLERCRLAVVNGEDFDLPASLLDEIKALSASAEPKCAHVWETGDNPMVGKVAFCTKCTETVLGSAPVEMQTLGGEFMQVVEDNFHELVLKSAAPVERDERAEIEEALLWLDDFVARCNGDDRGSCSAVETLRAALDIKASEGASHA